MKKLLLTLITFIYLMMSSGIAMEVHYCMGKRAGIDFYTSGESKCSKCGMKEKKGGCCHDEHRFIKLSNAHKNVAAENFLKIPAAPLSIPVFNFTAFLSSVTIISSHANAPPGLPQQDLCIRNCVFRI